MALTHDANITITVYLDDNPVGRASLTTPMIVVPISTNTLNGARTVTYSALSEATAAQTAGYISAATLAIVTRMFSQSPKPKTVKVGYINDTGAEAEADALTAIIASDSDFYLVGYSDRTDANTLALAAAIESNDKKMIGIFQSSNSDWKTTGLPAAFSTAAAYERSAVLYHDDDAHWNAEGWLAARGAFDPDNISAPWYGRVKSGDAVSEVLTETQRGFIQEFSQVGLPYGGAPYYVDPGQSFTGRPLYEQVSADWLSIRLQEDIAEAIVTSANRGEKIPVSATGQAILLGLINARLTQGQAAGHFDADPSEVSAVAEAITAADLAAERLRFTIRVKLAVGARIINLDVYASRNSIAA